MSNYPPSEDIDLVWEEAAFSLDDEHESISIVNCYLEGRGIDPAYVFCFNAARALHTKYSFNVPGFAYAWMKQHRPLIIPMYDMDSAKPVSLRAREIGSPTPGVHSKSVMPKGAKCNGLYMADDVSASLIASDGAFNVEHLIIVEGEMDLFTWLPWLESQQAEDHINILLAVWSGTFQGPSKARWALKLQQLIAANPMMKIIDRVHHDKDSIAADVLAALNVEYYRSENNMLAPAGSDEYQPADDNAWIAAGGLYDPLADLTLVSPTPEPQGRLTERKEPMPTPSLPKPRPRTSNISTAAKKPLSPKQREALTGRRLAWLRHAYEDVLALLRNLSTERIDGRDGLYRAAERLGEIVVAEDTQYTRAEADSDLMQAALANGSGHEYRRRCENNIKKGLDDGAKHRFEWSSQRNCPTLTEEGFHQQLIDQRTQAKQKAAKQKAADDDDTTAPRLRLVDPNDPSQGEEALPQVFWRGNNELEILPAIEQALADYERVALFQDSSTGTLVSIGTRRRQRKLFDGEKFITKRDIITSLIPVKNNMLIAMMNSVIDWQDLNPNKRQRKNTPSRHIASVILQSQNYPLLPTIETVLHRPTIALNGDVLSTDRYHEESMTLFSISNKVTLNVPENPTRKDAAAALDVILDILGDFPFRLPSHRAGSICSILTAISRPVISESVPLFLISSTAVGVGKSTLANLISWIAAGENCSSHQLPKNDDEMRKSITSTLDHDPYAIILYDNAKSQIGGAALESALTAETWTDRELGTNTNISGTLRFVWIATANTPEITPDMARRIVPIALAPVGDIHNRLLKYPHLRGKIISQRSTYLSACFTILRAHALAGHPEEIPGRKLSGYTQWDRIVRQAVVWAGRDSELIGDPLDALAYMLETADEQTLGWSVVMHAIFNLWSSKSWTAKDIADKALHYSNDTGSKENAEEEEDLLSALVDIEVFEPANNGGKFNLARFRWFLGQYFERPLPVYTLMPAQKANRTRSKRYSIQCLRDESPRQRVDETQTSA